MRYDDAPSTRSLTKCHGRFRVVSFVVSEYVLANLITHVGRRVHVKSLKIFNYDPSMGFRADTARREFFVEKVLAHSGDTKRPSSMSFHAKGLNYDESHNA